MPTQTAAIRSDILTAWRPGLWRVRLPQGTPLIAGITDRSGGLDTLNAQLATMSHGLVFAGQVHGASLAAVDFPNPFVNPLPACDGLTTTVGGVVLVIRTADCLPLFVWDPIQRVVGLAHVGWRGLARSLPMRMVAFVRQLYRSRPEDLWVGIGPAIRACCYEVGPEFPAHPGERGAGGEEHFGPFLQHHDGRRTCDLIACATHQLVASGVRAWRLVDCGQCTVCSTHPFVSDDGVHDFKKSAQADFLWHSVRRDGETGGRGLSFIMLLP